MIKAVKSLSIWIFGVLMFGLFANVNVHAADTSSTMKKWVFTGYAACARDAINTPLEFRENQSGLVSESVFNKGVGSVNLPSYGFGTNDGNSATIDCRGLFLGEGPLSKSGVLDYAGATKNVNLNDPKGVQSFLVDKVGYAFVPNGEKYFTIQATKQTCKKQLAFFSAPQEVCSNAEVSSARIVANGDGTYRSDRGSLIRDIQIVHEDKGMWVKIVLPTSNAAWEKLPNGQVPKHEVYIEYNSDINTFARAVENALRSLTASYETGGVSSYESGGTGTMTEHKKVTIGFREGVVLQGEDGEYRFPRTSNAIKESIDKLSGPDELSLTDSERYSLYVHYLKEAVGESLGTIACENDGTVGSNEFMVKLKSGNEFKNCRVSLGVSASEINVNDIINNRPFPTIATITLDKVINWLNNVDTSKLEDVDSIEDQNPISEDASSIRELCEKEDLNGQGWVLCPFLENATYTASGLDNIIQDWLSVDTSLYDYNSAAYQVWQVMRSFANILMIIILLFILFSQITGFGIDNYGIKKMLPRLIVAAVLINLSFIICTVVVDLSNIAGVGLRDLFGAIGNGLNSSQAYKGEDFIAEAVTLLLGGPALAGWAGSVALPVFLAGSFPMIIIMLILVLVGAIAAIALFFVMLSGRMLLVILCLSVAPLAFVLFILPNTQNIFKKWLSAFKAVIVLFPICGALGGISSLIKGIARTTNDYVMIIIGILAPFIIFFFLPSLLRNALSAVGQIGSAFQAMTQKIAGRVNDTRGTIQNSDIFKDAAGQAAAERAKKIRDKLNKKAQEKGGLNAIDSGRLRRASRTATLNEVSLERMYEDSFKYKSAGDIDKILDSAIKAENTEQAIAALHSLAKVDPGAALKRMSLLGPDTWKNMKSGFRERLVSAMATSGLDTMAGYAAHVGNNGRKSFGTYIDSPVEFDKEHKIVSTSSYAARLIAKGKEHASNLSKDDVSFIKDKVFKHMDKDELGATLGAIMTAHSNSEEYMGTVRDAIKDNRIRANQLGLTPENLASLDMKTINAMKDGIYARILSDDNKRAAIISDLQSSIDAARRNPGTLARMDQKVAEYLGLTGRGTNIIRKK